MNKSSHMAAKPCRLSQKNYRQWLHIKIQEWNVNRLLRREKITKFSALRAGLLIV
jgi:hypothetical protein